MSLRRRLVAVLLLAGVLALGGFTVSGLTMRHMVDLEEQLTTRYFDAVQLSSQHLLAQLDQETGLRGYELSGNVAFLTPYQAGIGNEAASYQQLQRVLAQDPALLAILERSQAAAQRWRQEYALPRLTLVQREGRFPLSQDELRLGKTLFDDVRATTDELNREILQARSRVDAQLSRAIQLLVMVFVLAAAATLLAGILLWQALRRWVTRPLDQMGADIAQVRSGGLQHEITPAGPKELAELGRAIEDMRRQVVTEYAAAVRARAETETASRTVEEQAVELRRSNRDLEQFAYVASHDLQEPLRKVSSFCQMLQRRYEGQLDERADQYINFAVDGAKRMQALINDLLTFSRVGRSAAGFTEVDLRQCFEQAVRVLDTRIEETGARVEASELPVVHGEASLLTQLFQNLIGNALKFRGPAAPVVRIAAQRQTEGETEEWQFTCSDNGIGIDAQYAEKIFVIFQRLHTKEEFGGTGIGLALCKKIVEYHGGRIWLDTAERTTPGTTFAWSLPVADAAEIRLRGGDVTALDLRQDGPPAMAGRPGIRSENSVTGASS